MDNIERLQGGVRQAYSAAAETPWDEHPFPVGRAFAESLGYPQEILGHLPSVCVDAFCGVSNVGIFAEIPEGSVVLDLGCGSGLDTLVAAQKVGSNGTVIGVDFSDAMLARASQAVAQVGFGNVRLELADAEGLPLEDGSVDVALVNGIFNLNPARSAIFGELARVVRGGGAVYAAELILNESLPPEIHHREEDWFA